MNQRERKQLKQECRAALEEAVAQFRRGIGALGFEVSREQLVLRARGDLREVSELFRSGSLRSVLPDEDVQERMVIAAEVVSEMLTSAAH